MRSSGPASVRTTLTAYAFLAPALLGLMVFMLVPMLYAFGLSFVRWDLIRPNPAFVGLENYVLVLSSPDFWSALQVTIIYTLGVVPLAMAIGLGLALLLNQRLPGLWVRELTPDGVREALLARRVFATRERVFRLDAAANGVRMGGQLEHAGGPVHLVVDIGGGKASWGRQLAIQLLGHGPVEPRVLWTGVVRVPRDDEAPIHFDVDVSTGETSWLVLRVGDPNVPDPVGLVHRPDLAGAAVAYSSPFYVA